MRRFLFRISLLLVLGFAAAPPVMAQNPGAGAVVDAFHATLLDVMKNADRLGMEGRYRRLAPEIERSFYLKLMIGIASGTSWRSADAAQRVALIWAFKKFSVANYAARFDSHGGESFTTISVNPGPRGTRLVHTRINRPGKSPVPISYVLKGSGGAWRIVDVLLEGGISELAVRRAEYKTVLSKRGADGLITLLLEKADRIMGR